MSVCRNVTRASQETHREKGGLSPGQAPHSFVFPKLSPLKSLAQFSTEELRVTSVWEGGKKKECSYFKPAQNKITLKVVFVFH